MSNLRWGFLWFGVLLLLAVEGSSYIVGEMVEMYLAQIELHDRCFELVVIRLVVKQKQHNIICQLGQFQQIIHKRFIFLNFTQ